MVFNLKKFHDIRVDNDLSQKEMSKLLQISEDAYSNYENGRSVMPTEIAVRFANYFKLSLDYLLNMTNKKNLVCEKNFNAADCSSKILSIRRQRSMSQEQIAKIVNIPQRTYSSYERNDRTIPLEFLFNIALKFEISLDYLTGRCEKSKIS